MPLLDKKILAVVAGCAGLFGAASAQAGLINPTSTVTPVFIYDQGAGPVDQPSQIFTSGAPPPFSLAAAYPAPNFSTAPFNMFANVVMYFTDTTITLYNNADAAHNAPFCFSSGNSGAACLDVVSKFDFAFTNEAITGATIDTAASTWNHWSGVQPTFGANDVTIAVTGDFPDPGTSLVIDLAFSGNNNGNAVPEPASLAVLTVGALSLFGVRRRQPHA